MVIKIAHQVQLCLYAWVFSPNHRINLW